MPLYEYKCDSCGYRTTKQFTVKKMEKTQIVCPYCGAILRQQMGTIASIQMGPM